MASTAIFFLRRLFSIFDILPGHLVEIVLFIETFRDFGAFDFFQMTAK